MGEFRFCKIRIDVSAWWPYENSTFTLKLLIQTKRWQPVELTALLTYLSLLIVQNEANVQSNKWSADRSLCWNEHGWLWGGCTALRWSERIALLSCCSGTVHRKFRTRFLVCQHQVICLNTWTDPNGTKTKLLQLKGPNDWNTRQGNQDPNAALMRQLYGSKPKRRRERTKIRHQKNPLCAAQIRFGVICLCLYQVDFALILSEYNQMEHITSSRLKILGNR